MSELNHPVSRIVRFLYNHNPFYVISAALFVYGLKRLFRSGDNAILFAAGSVDYIEPWGLVFSLAAVTVLMAVTAILIVRIGKVWEDARSLVLIVLLMLLAVSVSIDELALSRNATDQNTWQAVAMMIAGAAFSVLAGEVLVRAMRVRLSPAWRIPLYLLLIQFFVFPTLLISELNGLQRDSIRTLIASYPLVAGLITMLLIPAIRQGSESLRNNGTPWAWPWFPWSPFPIMGLAVVFRSWSLTISFDAPMLGQHFWDTAFGLYLLVPFALSILIILLETGIVEKRQKLITGVMWTAPLLLLLAHPLLVPWCNLPAYREMLILMSHKVGSPVFLTQLGVIGFYSWAWIRRVPYAEFCVCVALIVVSRLDPQGFVLSDSAYAQYTMAKWPYLIIAVLQLLPGIRTRNSFRCLLGGIALVFVFANSGLPALHSLRSTLASWHLLLLVVLLIGQFYKDDFAEFLRMVTPMGLTLMSIVTITLLFRSEDRILVPLTYAVAIPILNLAIGAVFRDRSYLKLAAAYGCLYLCGAMIAGIVQFFMATMPSGTKPVILAGVCFAAAVFISSLKSGLADHLRSRLAAGKRLSVGHFTTGHRDGNTP